MNHVLKQHVYLHSVYKTVYIFIQVVPFNHCSTLWFPVLADAYFTKTGLERSEGLSKDLEWFSQQNVAIPKPSNAGISYSKYLEELAEKSAPLFLSHFYNIYFSHIAGGQLIVNRVSSGLATVRVLFSYLHL